MAIGPSAAVLKQLNTLFQVGAVGGLTDGQLLDRFVQRRDEAAFAALVERHGPMVLRACRSRLGNRHDAEDAFQATFLVLAQKAPSIRKSEAVAGWLLGVAGRVSAKARAAARRRSIAEQKVVRSADVAVEERPPDPCAELYDELERLPEKYRLPIVLCHLEGLTYEQAALRIGCPIRTVQSRLARGRERLRGRLERRGLAPTAVVLGTAGSSSGSSWMVPVSLKEATVGAAVRFAGFRGAAVGASSTAASTLAVEVLRTMFLNQINALVKLVILLGVIGAGGWLARPRAIALLSDSPPARTARAQPAAPPPQEQAAPQRDESPFRMTGAVRVEGTGEPVAGARVQADLGTKDLSGDVREAVTDASGHYTIPLPEGNARALFFFPPPGYWLPDRGKNRGYFTVTPQEPVHRNDYFVRRGTIWTFRLTRGPQQEPVPSGIVWANTSLGEFRLTINERTGPDGYATATLPDEAPKLTISLSSETQDDGKVPLTLEWSRGFRPGAVRAIQRIDEPGEPRFRIIDEAGGSATIVGPVELSLVSGKLIISATLPALDPKAFGSVTGTVVDQNGRPVAGANVTIYFPNPQGGGAISGRDEHKVRTDNQGCFILRSVPRKSEEGDATKLRVVVYKDGYAGVDTSRFEFQPQDDGTQTVDPIRLLPGLFLSGRVVDPEGLPLVGAQVEAIGNCAQYAYTQRSGPDGRFTIPNLSRGTVRVAFMFGPLWASGTYVVDGKSDPVTVRLRPSQDRKPAAEAAKPQPAATLTVGQEAPAWHVRGWTDGKPRSLADFRGKLVVLDFWGIWCSGCVGALPALDRLRGKFEPRGVAFLSIHTPGETLDEVRKLYQLKKVSLQGFTNPRSQGSDQNRKHEFFRE